METKKFSTKHIVVLGIFAALSIALVYFIHLPIIPSAPFLEYDPADIPILIITFAYGPLAGFILTLIVSVIQGLTVSAASGVYGIIMHVIATGTFVLVAGNIYKKNKTIKRALLALVCGIIAWVIVMIGANCIITPLFMGTPREVVYGMLIPAIIPFNLIKSGINAVITFIVYKATSKVIK